MFTIEKWNLQTIRKEGELCNRKLDKFCSIFVECDKGHMEFASLQNLEQRF